MEMSHEKAQGTAKVLSRIFSVLYWISMVFLFVGAAFYIVQFFIPETFFTLQPRSSGFSFDNTLYFLMNDNNFDLINIKPLLQTFLPFAIVIVLMFIIGINRLIKILKNVDRGNPFSEDNAGSLAIIGIDLIVASFVVNLSQVVFISQVTELLKINNMRVNYSIDISFLMTGLLVLILSGIFKYGSFLKAEYDQTV